jgi:hypothetical protein
VHEIKENSPIVLNPGTNQEEVKPFDVTQYSGVVVNVKPDLGKAEIAISSSGQKTYTVDELNEINATQHDGFNEIVIDVQVETQYNPVSLTVTPSKTKQFYDSSNDPSQIENKATLYDKVTVEAIPIDYIIPSG